MVLPPILVDGGNNEIDFTDLIVILLGTSPPFKMTKGGAEAPSRSFGTKWLEVRAYKNARTA